MLTQYPISKDSRYTITKEYTGHESGKPQFIVRFCGKDIASCGYYTSALLKAVVHSQGR